MPTSNIKVKKLIRQIFLNSNYRRIYAIIVPNKLISVRIIADILSYSIFVSVFQFNYRILTIYS